MKVLKIVSKVAEIAFIINVIIFIGVHVVDHGFYERQGIVSEVNEENEATIVDTTGNIWKYESLILSEGQAVTLRMNNNETDEVFDDIITKVTVLGI